MIVANREVSLFSLQVPERSLLELMQARIDHPPAPIAWGVCHTDKVLQYLSSTLCALPRGGGQYLSINSCTVTLIFNAHARG